MNCCVCGSPLLFDRVVFRCSCGAYVHAYCADKHIVDAHRPELEEGYADLNGEFHPKCQPVAAPDAVVEPPVQLSEGRGDEEEEEKDGAEEELVSGEQVVVEQAEGFGDEDSDEDR